MSDRDAGHLNQLVQYFGVASMVRTFGSITDTIFRRRERKDSHQENLDAQKKLKYLDHQYRSQEQKKAYQRAKEQHFEGIRLKAVLDKEAQKREHMHQDKMAQFSHKNKIEEGEHIHRHKLEQAEQNHTFQIDTMEHKALLDQQFQERAYELQMNQVTFSSQLNLLRELIVRQAAHQDTKEIEEYKMAMRQLERYLQRMELYSPFLDLPEKLRETYFKTIYSRGEKQPLVLVSDFYRDNTTDEENERTRQSGFSALIDEMIGRVFNQNVVKRNKYFKRPLYREDWDIDVILPALADIPTILIHGKVKDCKEVEPMITVWNLPGCVENDYFKFQLGSFPISLNKTDSYYQELKVAIANQVTTIVGILSDAYHLVFNGKRPCLTNYASDNPDQLKYLAEELDFYYNLVYQANPAKESFYRLQQAIMLRECGLEKEATEQIEISFKILTMQKVGQEFLPDTQWLRENLGVKDIQFLQELANFYRSGNTYELTKTIEKLIQDFKTSNIQPISRFVY